MKRVVLIVLLVAGALALLYFVTWVSSLLSLFAPFVMPATGSGGIGSVSADPWEPVFMTVFLLASSLLLWRACASLAAGGDQVMAWHRRFHGWAAIVGLLLIPSVAGLAALALAMAPPDPIRPGGDWTWILVLAALGLMIASYGLNVMQLYSVVVALRRRT
jgi:hypothetical protein